MNTIRSVCVYCGSSPGNDDLYVKAGHALGRSIAQAGLELIYGGGGKGIMGAVADGALRAGGKVTGIIPRFLMTRESTQAALQRLDDLIVTENMHQRKHAMFEKSDAFVALPGGIGTVEEIIEIMTWAQLGHHRKPIVFANIGGFWDPMLKLMRHMADAGFVHAAHLVQPIVIDEPDQIVPALIDHWSGAVERGGEAGIIARL